MNSKAIEKVNTNTEVRRVQVARPEDVPELVALGYKNYNSFDSDLSAPSMDKVLMYITDGVINGVPLVYKDEAGKILGCLLMKQQCFGWWSDEQGLAVYLFYVLPEHRHKRIAFTLLQAAKEFAKDSKLQLALGLMGGASLKRKEKLLEKFGFKKRESIYSSDFKFT